MKKELFIVVVHYSFDSQTEAVLFNSYKQACDYIRQDFLKEKYIDEEENGWIIDENLTYCEKNMAVLATIYNGTTETTTWTIANITDNR